jgi:drug/metabolite transporter (DMT)-like permease
MTIGVLLALGSALVWGSGDFCGGRAVARSGPFQVLALAAISGTVLLAAAALLSRERVALDASIGWAVAGGFAGAGGIVALYRGLAVGNAATVAPLAAVSAAMLPVLFSAVTQGLPGASQVVGFALALVGIWLVARSTPDGHGSKEGARLGALAGIGFGGFLILIAQVRADAVYVPLAIARVVMLATAVAVLTARQVPFPGLLSNPLGLLAGVFDAGGNVLYLLARQHVRLDIAAVLSSLYPVSTVLLARAITREPVAPTQWLGAAVCLGAVALIAV